MNWEDLDEAQKSAFVRICRVLHEAVPPRPGSGVPPLDAVRESRIFFLSGQRGTGKTSVFATLRAASGHNPPVGLPAQAEVLRRHIVWLEPLDMEPAPRSWNLVPAILARLEAAVGSGVSFPGDDGEDWQYGGLLRSGTDPQQALIDLQQFQARFAVGWQGNSADRSSNVDPDSYAAEVMLEERARLGLRENFHKVLEELAQIIRRQLNGAEPLFVLPIDDVDLAPDVTVEILQLLRMLSVPRLFALVLGDIEVAETVFNLEMSERLASAAGRNSQLLSVLPDLTVRIASTAASLAANLLRKFVPPNQRYILEPLSLQEGLSFRPLEAPEASLRLHALLAQYPMAWDESLASTYPRIRTLRDFLLAGLWHPQVGTMAHSQGSPIGAPEITGEKVSGKDLETTAYIGREVVSTVPRRLVDLSFALERGLGHLNEDERTVPWGYLRERLGEYMASVVREEPALLPNERATLVDAVRRRVVGWATGSWGVRVDFQFVERTFTPRRQESPDVAPPGWARDVAVSEFVGWSLAAPVEGGARTLPLHTAAALALYHDLTVLGLEAPRFASPLFHSGMLPRGFARTAWRSPEASEAIEVPWPLPPFNSFWEWDLFLRIWNQQLQVTGGIYGLEEYQIVELFLLWAGAAATVLTGKEARPSGGHAPMKLLEDQRLEELARAAQLPDQRGRKAHEWLVQVALLISPETGVPYDALGQVPPSLSDFWQRDSVKQQIRERRTNRTRLLYEADPKGWPAVVNEARPGLTPDHNPKIASPPKRTARS